MFARRKKRAGTRFLAAILLLSAVLGLADYFYYHNRIYPGARLRDESLAGLNPGEVEETLSKLDMVFTGPEGFHLLLPLAELGIRVDPEKAFEAGYRLGRQKPWPLSLMERFLLYRRGAFIPLPYQVEEDLLDQSLRQVAAAFGREPRDAYFKLVEGEGRAELQAERMGFQTDPEELKAGVKRTLTHLNTILALEVPVTEEFSPKITAALLRERGVEDLMSTFSTRFDTDIKNRAHNIQLGASYLNNQLLPPGGVLSVNALLGDSTEDKGYKEAPVILEGRLVPGIGGGLCQVSTTLYNAALLANLPVIQRRNHGLTVAYVEPGRDAAIAFPATDLKILNDRSHYIWISAGVEGGELTFSLFGRPTGEKVVISSKILETYEPPRKYAYDTDLAPGEEKVEEGKPGYLVEVWKKVYREGKIVSEKKISLDFYNPLPTLVRRGPLAEKGP